MDIPINAEVQCLDGSCGHMYCVIVNPFTNKITHLVVKEIHFPHTERIVSERFIAQTTPNSIQLSYNKAGLSMMDEFIGYRFTQLEPPHEHPPFDFTYY